MCISRIILIFLFSFFFLCNSHAFMDSTGEGAQSTGREDLSFLEAKNSNYKKGRDALKQALKYEKKNKLKKANKKFEKALKYFVAAYEETPYNVEIINLLGFTYFKVGDLLMTEIYYKEGLSIDPKNSLINGRLGLLYLKTNRLNLAKERLKTLSDCDCEEYIQLKSIIDKY